MINWKMNYIIKSLDFMHSTISVFSMRLSFSWLIAAIYTINLSINTLIPWQFNNIKSLSHSPTKSRSTTRCGLWWDPLSISIHKLCEKLLPHLNMHTKTRMMTNLTCICRIINYIVPMFHFVKWFHTCTRDPCCFHGNTKLIWNLNLMVTYK